MQKIKIIIEDDHEIIAEGVKSLLVEAENIEILTDVRNGEKLLEILKLISERYSNTEIEKKSL